MKIQSRLWPRLLCCAAVICSAASAVAESDKNAVETVPQPLKTMSLCLVMHKWSAWGIWQFAVYALANDKILIGSLDNHFLVAADQPGYRHVIDGKVVANYADAVDLDNLGAQCQANCPPNFQSRVDWFKRRCQQYR